METLRPADLAKSTVVEVWVERLDPVFGEDFGWHKVDAVKATRRNPILRVSGEDCNALRCIIGSLTGTQLEVVDVCTPDEVTTRCQVFRGVPHRAIIDGIHTHVGIITPT